MVFWCFGVFVFWLKVKIHFKGLACGFVRLVVSSFGRLVVSNRGSDDLQGFGLPMSGQSIRWVFRPVSFWKSLSPVTNGIWGSIARQLAACSASGVRSLCWARSRVASSMMVRSSCPALQPVVDRFLPYCGRRFAAYQAVCARVRPGPSPRGTDADSRFR